MILICCYHTKYFPGEVKENHIVIVTRHGAKEYIYTMHRDDLEHFMLSHGMCRRCGELMMREEGIYASEEIRKAIPG